MESLLGCRVRETEQKFLQNLMEYFDHPRFKTDSFEEKAFKSDPANAFVDMCTYLAVMEWRFYDKRADTLRSSHPLAMQVELKTGVANGILVARNYVDCAKLIKKVLTNSLEFDISYRSDNEQNLEDHHLRCSVTELVERVTQCPHRVVTGDEKITNSFWNFYLTSEDNYVKAK